MQVSATDRFSDYVTEFEDHAEKMCQVGSLAAASSTDAKSKATPFFIKFEI